MPRENPPPLRRFYRQGGTVRIVGVRPPLRTRSTWRELDPPAEPKKKPKDYLAIEEENEWRL